MQRYCATCGTLISADDINVDRAAANCHVCKSVTTVDQVGTQTVSSEVPSSPKRRNRREIARPSHFSVKDDGSSLRISFRWIWRGFIDAAMKCLLWNSFLVGFYWLALTNGDHFFMWLSVIFCSPHVALGLLFVYATLALLLNRTLIKVTSEFITVRHGPLPWWGNQSLPIGELEGLYCYKHTRKDSVSVSYSVKALTKEAKKVDLITDLHNVAEAVFIKQELERWLKIDDGGVGRAFSRPRFTARGC